MLLIFSVLVSLAFSAHVEVPHLYLDMDGYEYENEMGQKNVEADELQPILDMGKRNLQWLDFINKNRPDDKKLQLSTPETQIAYPVEQPLSNNRTIVKNMFSDLKTELPDSISEILFSSADFPINPPMEDEAFLVFIRKVDRTYQRASRWLLQEPYLFQYSLRLADDIRGYYFLSKEKDMMENLKNWQSLPEATKSNYTEWLTGLCVNTHGNTSQCRRKLESSIQTDGNPVNHYNAFIKNATKVFESFFKIENSRTDIVWNNSDANVAHVPFLTPEKIEVREWLDINIADEWRWNNWQLKLNFVAQGPHAFVVFVPGATPNVNGLGGNRITMDANRNINEYTSRWTIRHEYGHTLGFPDCYIEFYDSEKATMINYQIDITNLMCSRRGKLKDVHFNEMERNYFGARHP